MKVWVTLNVQVVPEDIAHFPANVFEAGCVMPNNDVVGIYPACVFAPDTRFRLPKYVSLVDVTADKLAQPVTRFEQKFSAKIRPSTSELLEIA